jgi:hypothetical protein
MKIRDIVRTAVIKTNPYWPFSTMNGLPYYLAIKAFVRLCNRFPEIKSVYLRSGLVEGNWVPALSDIDFTVITDSRLGLEEEFLFLRSFWEGFASLKKLFPMLGEIDVLNDEHIGSWTQFGLPGYCARNWRLVYGVETLKNNYVLEPLRFKIDCINYALNYAFWFYRGYFVGTLFRKDESSYLVSQDLKRLASKISRSLDYIGYTDGKKQGSEARLDNKTDMLCCILNDLEKSIAYVTASSPGSIRNNNEAWLGNVDTYYHEPIRADALDMNASASWSETIESITLDYHSRVFLIVKNGFDATALTKCIDSARAMLGPLAGMPVIASPWIFNYMLRYYEPFKYLGFMRRRRVVLGKDLLRSIQPPDRDAFVNYLFGQTPNVLTFPQGRTFISSQTPDRFLERQFESMLERSLLLKLYLEKGVVQPLYDELLAECQKHYQGEFIQWGALKENKGAIVHQEWFRLLKGIVNDVQSCLTNSTEWRTFH